MLGRGLQSLIPPTDPIREEPQQPQQAQQPVEPAQPVEIPHAIEPVAPVIPAAQAAPVVREPEPPLPSRGGRPSGSGPKIPDAIFQIEVEKIKPNPDQPRRTFDEAGLKELASSIREFGLLQPVVVTKLEREVPNGTEVEYVLISGERRLMASKMLGLPRIPAIIRTIDFDRERLELAIIENIQRENLNPIEVARSFSRLQEEFRLTQREIAARLGKSREVVANGMRLLDLPLAVQEAIERGQVSESHGRLLLTIDNPAIQEKLFQDLIAQHLTTRELRERVDALRVKPVAPEAPQMSPELKMAQQKLSSNLGAPVAIQKNGQAGKIMITFYSEEELQGILQRLEREG